MGFPAAVPPPPPEEQEFDVVNHLKKSYFISDRTVCAEHKEIIKTEVTKRATAPRRDMSTCLVSLSSWSHVDM